jgi:Serine carboxypeptidase S28
MEPYAFTQRVTQIYSDTNAECPKVLAAGFRELHSLRERRDMYDEISEIWGLCSSPTSGEDIDALLDLGDRALTKAAVLNYAYPSHFLTSLPPHAVSASCSATLSKTSLETNKSLDAVIALAKATRVYFSSEGCIDLASYPFSLPKNGTWKVLFCNFFEDTYRARNGETDMFFPPYTWSLDQSRLECQKMFGITATLDKQFDTFGGRDPKKDFSSVSNLIFSNGELDPWIIGGITEPVSDKSTVIVIKDCAHCSDLHTPTTLDPPALSYAREQEIQIMKNWIREYEGISLYNDEL